MVDIVDISVSDTLRLSEHDRKFVRIHTDELYGKLRGVQFWQWAGLSCHSFQCLVIFDIMMLLLSVQDPM